MPKNSISAPNKWHYINLEMNLNKYSDVIPNG